MKQFQPITTRPGVREEKKDSPPRVGEDVSFPLRQREEKILQKKSELILIENWGGREKGILIFKKEGKKILYYA